MIELILQMLQLSEFEGQSKAIDIAKGKHKITWSFKEKSRQLKRTEAWRLRK